MQGNQSQAKTKIELVQSFNQKWQEKENEKATMKWVDEFRRLHYSVLGTDPEIGCGNMSCLDHYTWELARGFDC